MNHRSKDFLTESAAKRAYNRWLFRIVASRYGIVTRALSFGMDSSWKKWLVSHVPQTRSPRVIDIAAGNADLAMSIVKKMPHARIAAADITPEMFFAPRAYPLPASISFSVQDMWALGFKTACADIVTGGYALRNAPDLSATIAEVRRILRPGGTAAFLDFSKSPNVLLARIEYVLLAFWGSLWGLLLHGKPEIYAYIAKSLLVFPDSPALHSLLASYGLRVTKSKRFFFGIIEILICGAIEDHPLSK